MKSFSSVFMYTISILLLVSQFAFTQTVKDTSGPVKHILHGVNGGYRINLNSNPDLNSNGFIGFSVDIPITTSLSISSGIGFWNSSANYIVVTRDYSVIDIPLLIKYRKDMTGKGLELFIGTGLLKISEHSDKLITLNIGASGWYELSNSFRITLGIKFQKANSLEPGGGNSISSIYIGPGLNVQIN